MYTARTSRPSFPGAGERARLSIKGVASPVGLRVARRREGQVTLVQELPFLALGNEVKDDRGRTGKIARVAVSIDQGVPKLVIELAYDAAQQDDRPSGPPAVKTPARARSERERDQTIGYDERPTLPDLPGSARLTRTESSSSDIGRERRDDTNRELTLAFRTELPRPAPIDGSPSGAPSVRAPTALRRRAEEGLVDALLARVVAFIAMFVALVSPRTT